MSELTKEAYKEVLESTGVLTEAELNTFLNSYTWGKEYEQHIKNLYPDTAKEVVDLIYQTQIKSYMASRMSDIRSEEALYSLLMEAVSEVAASSGFEKPFPNILDSIIQVTERAEAQGKEKELEVLMDAFDQLGLLN